VFLHQYFHLLVENVIKTIFLSLSTTINENGIEVNVDRKYIHVMKPELVTKS
jgi:hypothetical protein